jgi:hypothetical protein
MSRGRRVAFWALMAALTAATCSFVALVYFGIRGRELPRLPMRITGDWLIESDPEIGFVPARHAKTEMEHLDSGLHYHVYTDGRRARVDAPDRETPIPVDIVAVGCSFTWGTGVESGDTHPQQLGRILGASVANLGMGSYGSVQAFQTLARNADLAPRVVVYAFIQNHLRRNLSPCAPNFVPYCLPVAYLERQGDWMTLQPPHLEYWSPSANRAFMADVSLRDPSGVTAWLLRAKWAARIALFQYVHSDTIAIDASPESAAGGIRAMIDAMQNEARAMGAHLVVINLPYLRRGRVQPVPPALTAAVAGKDLSFVDFAPVAAAYYARHPTGSLVLPNDPHPNAEAHRLIAETLAPAVGPLLAAPRSQR